MVAHYCKQRHEDARAFNDPSANAGLQMAERSHCRCSNPAATFAVFKGQWKLCGFLWEPLLHSRVPNILERGSKSSRPQGCWTTCKKSGCPTTWKKQFHPHGCEFQNRDSLMTWSWGSLLAKQPSLSAHLLIAAIPKSCTLATTWPALDAWIAWSFKALSKGWHPTEDPWGEPWTKGVIAELAGKPLAKGHRRGTIWAIQGDQDFFSNVLKLPH